MPRPEISLEVIAAMEASFQAFLLAPPDDLKMLAQIANELIDQPGSVQDAMREIMFSGWWLEDKLKAMECTQTADICFAHGQVCMPGIDPWAAANRMLELHAAGVAPKPGPELAERIFRGEKI